jgi:predicted ATP-grasp superfamily ATP-dependent carboligase
MTVLIAAIAGRALAASARRAGVPVVVADFFGDLDTRALARWLPLPGDLETGVDGERLRDMIEALGQPVEGIVYGAGFEATPELLDELAGAAPLVGNSPAVVRAVKDPFAFSRLLERLGVPCPRVSAQPLPGGEWLRKRRGGAGGAHVRPAPPPEPGCYYQERARGRPVSALFSADGRHARLLGVSEQWPSPTAAAPFRYGGCAGPAAIPARLAAQLADVCDAVVAATGLVGLNSLDTLAEDAAFTVLEVNPRPGATLDVFDEGALWRAHLDGVAGRLSGPEWTAAIGSRARAAAVVYAERAVRVGHDLPKLPRIADIPAPESIIPAGAPVCTVLAKARHVEAARDLARRRSGGVQRSLAPAENAA